MHSTHDQPFPIDLRQSTEMELAEDVGCFDLPKHWLDALFSFAVAGSPYLGLELPLHLLAQSSAVRNPSARCRLARMRCGIFSDGMYGSAPHSPS